VPTIDELFPTTCDCINPIEQALADGFLRRQEHPAEPLAILNYTARPEPYLTPTGRTYTEDNA
jgi:hypothetical protein